MAAVALARVMAALPGAGLSTLQGLRRQIAGDGDHMNRRQGSHRQASHRLGDEERQRNLPTCNHPEIAASPHRQIVPALAHRGRLIGSERSFDPVLHANVQSHQRDRAHPRQAPRPVQPVEPEGPIGSGAGT